MTPCPTAELERTMILNLIIKLSVVFFEILRQHDYRSPKGSPSSLNQSKCRQLFLIAQLSEMGPFVSLPTLTEDISSLFRSLRYESRHYLANSRDLTAKSACGKVQEILIPSSIESAPHADAHSFQPNMITHPTITFLTSSVDKSTFPSIFTLPIPHSIDTSSASLPSDEPLDNLNKPPLSSTPATFFYTLSTTVTSHALRSAHPSTSFRSPPLHTDHSTLIASSPIISSLPAPISPQLSSPTLLFLVMHIYATYAQPEHIRFSLDELRKLMIEVLSDEALMRTLSHNILEKNRQLSNLTSKTTEVWRHQRTVFFNLPDIIPNRLANKLNTADSHPRCIEADAPQRVQPQTLVLHEAADF
ncbi:hypothetical protein BLNAU_21913 [Blattamonas nauphoetae]|uniref:Uncharacterized protein n=1 Tax=Blattamonas nauphoetae TaxID=2049346 RepID=A0ABQ9WUM1_9EUKA|nr:hypothetical protein BLNAU_21913 [Blattamonas nauphoetae]